MPVDPDSAEATTLKQKVDDQGVQVRNLKSSGADKSAVDEAVQLLLKLKTDYKELTGVDLSAGGSSKKSKKDKKGPATKEPPAKQAPQPKKAKQVQIQDNIPTPAVPDKGASAVKSGSTGQDMRMPAVLARLAQRAGQTDQLVAHLRTQLDSVRQTSALSACKAEEGRLREENASLKQQLQNLKHRLVQAETKNGVKQVALPSQRLPGEAATNKPVTAAKTEVSAPQQQQNQEPKKKKEKEAKPKAAPANADSAVVDISRIDMRVGEIVNVKLHPDADSLYVEEVNLGEGKHRTILSGLVKHIPIEQMQNRLAIFMTNLKPAKMRGIFSEGMIMCGSTPEKVEIIELPSGAKVGDKVYVEGFEGTPDQQLNPKKKVFEQVQPDLKINDSGVATYKGAVWKVKDLEGLCTVPTMRGTPIK